MKVTSTFYEAEKIVKEKKPSLTISFTKEEAAEVAAILGDASTYSGSHSYRAFNALSDFARSEMMAIQNNRLSRYESGRLNLSE